jgi:SAM-dependent methyltransferase
MMLSAPRTDYDRLIDVAFSFWQTHALYAAVQLDLFTALHDGPKTAPELAAAVALHPRAAKPLLEALVALRLLECRAAGHYANADVASRFLSRRGGAYLGDLFAFAAARLVPVWMRLPDALRSGEPQNEALTERDYYANLCGDADRLAMFMSAMDALSAEAAERVAEVFPWRRYRSFLDAGGGRGALAIRVSRRHPHLRGINFDLPAVRPYFDQHVAAAGFAERITFAAGDFFRDPLPRADVIVMGHVLHNWGGDDKRRLIRAAWESLPADGALLIYEWFAGDECHRHLLGLLMSLNMLLVTREGCAIGMDECEGLLREGGFRGTECLPLSGPCSMVIGWKSR